MAVHKQGEAKGGKWECEEPHFLHGQRSTHQVPDLEVFPPPQKYSDMSVENHSFGEFTEETCQKKIKKGEKDRKKILEKRVKKWVGKQSKQRNDHSRPNTISQIPSWAKEKKTPLRRKREFYGQPQKKCCLWNEKEWWVCVCLLQGSDAIVVRCREKTVQGKKKVPPGTKILDGN